MKNEIFEKEFKVFLDEICNKYKDIIPDSNAPVVTARKMNNEIRDYMLRNIKKIYSMEPSQEDSIISYAIELGTSFKDPNLGRSFWYSGVGYNFISLPMEK